ncbi:amidohydrolase family protein [Pigmentiphaga litoralis]|uniref:amidohydrolase family protein n=1 Tax=Pigmentiphaga litoralis TaxID=516702 RepID=UPI003B42AB03
MPDCAPPLSHPSAPRHALPPLACDSHCHVFGPGDRFPYAEGRSYTPPDAPYEKLAALHAHVGASRAVIVQANCHGTDHSALLDTLARSEGRYRGVCLLGAEATDAQVRALHDGGMRGVRFNFVPHLGGAPSPEVFDRIVDLVAPYGWHIALHIDGKDLTQHLDRFVRLPMPFVIDHMARIRADRGLDDPAFVNLLRLKDVPTAWVKVSGIDRISSGKRPFDDGLPYVRALIGAMPDRLVWGTDWPHPNVAGDMPDDGELVNSFFEACPDAATRQKILVDNPARLFKF